jgi:hypothetical protein
MSINAINQKSKEEIKKSKKERNLQKKRSNERILEQSTRNSGFLNLPEDPTMRKVKTSK